MLKNILKQLLTLIFSENVVLFKRKVANKIFLSFDDGPHPEFTVKVLDVLKTHNVKAEFYLIGANAQKHPEIVKRMVAEGHVIGSHSFSHQRFGSLVWPEQRQEIINGVETIKTFHPHAKLLFRPPQGRFNLKQILFCKTHRITIVMWTVDSLDYDHAKTKEEILERLKSFSWRGGEIVLFHDDNQVTVDVLPEFIRWIKSKNMEFAV